MHEEGQAAEMCNGCNEGCINNIDTDITANAASHSYAYISLPLPPPKLEPTKPEVDASAAQAACTPVRAHVMEEEEEEDSVIERPLKRCKVSSIRRNTQEIR